MYVVIINGGSLYYISSLYVSYLQVVGLASVGLGAYANMQGFSVC